MDLPDAAREAARESRREQGLPETVEDAGAVELIATLVPKPRPVLDAYIDAPADAPTWPAPRRVRFVRGRSP